MLGKLFGKLYVEMCLVTEIVVHTMSKMAHLDEFTAICILWMFGDTKFKGIQDAAIVEYDKNIHAGNFWKLLNVDHCLRIGCVEGDPTDEHPHTNNPQHCSATLVMEHLGLWGQNRRLDDLVTNVFKSDSDGSPHFWHAERVMKRLGAMYRIDEVFWWLRHYIYAALKTDNRGCSGPAKNFDRIAAHVFAERQGISVARAQNGSSVFMATLEAAGLLADPRFAVFAKNVRGCTENRPCHPLHIAAMVETIHASDDMCAETLKKWVGMWMEAEIAKQQELLDAKDFIAKGHAKVSVVQNRATGRQLKLCVAHTNNDSFAQAARLPHEEGGVDAALVLQFRTEGGFVYISPSVYKVPTKNMELLTVLLREEEERILTGRRLGVPCPVARQVLGADGLGPSKTIYYQANAGQVFNGSLTHPDIPRTIVSNQTFGEICRRFLNEAPLPRIEQRRWSRGKLLSA